MTIEQDALRADLRARMTASMPDYSLDSEAVGRVGKVIGETAGHEERKVRASDSRRRSTDKLTAEDDPNGPISSLWIVSLCLCTVLLLSVLAYWRLA